MSTFLERQQAKKILRLNNECAHLLRALRAIRDLSNDHDDAKTMAREELEGFEESLREEAI